MRHAMTAPCLLVAFSFLMFASPAAAQMSITTIGATDAVNCYKDARNDFVRSTTSCDDALKGPSLTLSDKKKTLVNRGIIRNRNGDLDAAIEDFNGALEIDASLGEAYLNRGNSYYLARDYEGALSDYHHSLDLEISKPWAAWYNIGLVHEAQNDRDGAREAYKSALETNPDFTAAKRKLADLGEG